MREFLAAAVVIAAVLIARRRSRRGPTQNIPIFPYDSLHTQRGVRKQWDAPSMSYREAPNRIEYAQRYERTPVTGGTYSMIL